MIRRLEYYIQLKELENFDLIIFCVSPLFHLNIIKLSYIYI
jgi:hypothetical protein